MDISHSQDGQGAWRHIVHPPASPPQASTTAGERTHPHQGPRQHRRKASRSGRVVQIRRLGDGYHHRQGRQGRHRHAGGAHHKEAPYGQVSQRQERKGRLKARRTTTQALFEHHVLSITTDNGTEFADHKYIAKMLHTKVYFAHPYSSWEKGLIENTNKLIRQYIPIGTDFSSLSDDYILYVQTELNLRPGKLLNFSSPKQKSLLSFIELARKKEETYILQRLIVVYNKRFGNSGLEL